MPINDAHRFPRVVNLLVELAKEEEAIDPFLDAELAGYRLAFAASFLNFVVERLDDIDESRLATQAFMASLCEQPKPGGIGDFVVVAVCAAARAFMGVRLARPDVPPPNVVAAAAIREAGAVFAPGRVDIPAVADERREMVLADALCANAGGCNSLRYAHQTVAMRVMVYGGAETLGTLNAAGQRLVEQRPDVLFKMLVTSLEVLCCNSARKEHAEGAGYVNIPVGTPTAAS